MKIKESLFRVFYPIHFQNEEDTIRGTALLILSSAALVAFVIIMGVPLVTFDFQFINMIKLISVVTLLSLSLTLLYKKMLAGASYLLLVTLIGFIMYQVSFEIYGIHDTALYAIPGIFIIAGVLLKKWQFYSFVLFTLIWFAVISVLESIGFKKTRYGNPESIQYGIDIIVIFAFTALGVYSVASRYIKDYVTSRRNEVRLRELNLTKDKFFSIISHDLKNPFSSISGFTELLLENFREYDNDKIEEQLKIIADSSDNALSILENLMIWSRSQRGKLEFNPALTDIRKCIVENIQMVEDQAKIKKINISFEYSDELPVYCDKNMIDTVLRNLLTNAIKFTPREGNISIGIKTGDEEIEISVTDSGVGIKKENLDRLFRLDGNLTTNGTENEKGTGLGLILCKEFIDKNGGKIWAESEPDKGSRFVFTLPRQNTSDHIVNSIP